MKKYFPGLDLRDEVVWPVSIESPRRSVSRSFFKVISDYSNLPDFGNFDINDFGSSSNPAGSIQDLIPDNVKCETKLSRRPRAGARIVGGTIVNRNTWKWYVRLRKCSDTILSDRPTNPEWTVCDEIHMLNT